MDCKTVLDYLFSHSSKTRQIVIFTEASFEEFWSTALQKGIRISNCSIERVKLSNICREWLSGQRAGHQTCIVFRPVNQTKETSAIHMLWGVRIESNDERVLARVGNLAQLTFFDHDIAS
jgi:hypothetical protein